MCGCLKQYAYPDVMVVAGELQLQEGRTDTIAKPVMIAEVLSGSTQGYDRGDKFAAYRTISTLQEYLLIDQHTLHVEQYARTDANKWIFAEYAMDWRRHFRWFRCPSTLS
ncbi:Uma2 family endonuclease [Leptolyngbyaceae cyanobacterium UHCC 1019]